MWRFSSKESIQNCLKKAEQRSILSLSGNGYLSTKQKQKAANMHDQMTSPRSCNNLAVAGLRDSLQNVPMTEELALHALSRFCQNYILAFFQTFCLYMITWTSKLARNITTSAKLSQQQLIVKKNNNLKLEIRIQNSGML